MTTLSGIKSNFMFNVDHKQKLLEIIDCCDGNQMSVTNNAEGVLTEILEKRGSFIKEYSVVYRDTDGNWDSIIPTWVGENCDTVKFQSGVGEFQTTL